MVVKPKQKKSASIEEEKESISDSRSDEDSSQSEEEQSSDEEATDDTSNFSDEDEEDDDSVESDPVVTPKDIKPVASSVGEQCTFDLRHLVAVNSHQVNSSKLYKQKTKKDTAEEDTTTIPPDNLSHTILEEHLLERASDGCAQLIGALWQLPTEKSDAGPQVFLPSYAETKLPRELPPPPPRQETKWEKFAKERGIPLNKSKRSRKVWDEATQSWMYRTGYEKANNTSKEWPIMEVKGNEDPFEDPWERMRDAKRSRVEKNMENRMRNAERAGVIPKGTATRTIKNLQKTRKAGKEGGNSDRDNVAPSGIPVDLHTRKGTEKATSMKRGRDSHMKAIVAAQVSTASMGKFDRMREGEPERRKAMAGLKKRKFESATDKKVISRESERGLKVLNVVLNGGGKAREKAARKGALATGETAYDYEYDDGLGASTFRKKKGRAAAGKMKKLTKKRVK